MTAIRGLKGLYPCPVCLVPQDKQGDHTETYTLRSTQSMHQVYEEALAQTTREAEEGVLKEVSLRPIKVLYDFICMTSSSTEKSSGRMCFGL